MYMIPKIVHATIGGLFFINYFDLLNRFDIYKSNVKEAVVSPIALVNEINAEGLCPIHLATKSDNFDAVYALVESFGADINAETKNEQYTPLIFSIKQSNHEIFHYLLSKEALNVNTVTEELKSPLHFASEQNNLEMIESLLEKDATITHLRGTRQSPFHLAVRSGKLAAARLFGTRILGIGHTCLDLTSTLESSVHFLARQLLPVEVWLQMLDITLDAIFRGEAGRGLGVPIIDRRSLQGMTPLQLAIEEANDSAIAGFIVSGADINVVFFNHFSRVINPLVKVVRDFFGEKEVKFNPNIVRSSDSENIWHLAARTNSVPFIKCLVLRFPNLQPKIHDFNSNEHLPLQLAFQLKHFQIASELIKLHDKHIGSTVLEGLIQSSVTNAQYSVLFALLQSFTEMFLNYVYSVDGSLLHSLVILFPDDTFDRKNCIKFLVLLFQYCPNILQTCDASLGRTAIHTAIHFEKYEFIKVLRDVKLELPDLDFNVSSEGGKKLFSYLKETGKGEILNQLQ